MALGDGIRRNFAHISQAERDRFVAAVKKMHDTLTFSDGVNYFSKQEQSHELAHGSAVSPHDPVVFMVWHRELINRFEALLRVADPDLSLHYWDWTEDARNASDGVGGHVNLMTASQMGDDGSAGINRLPGTGTGQGGGDVGPPFATFETQPISTNPNDPPNDNPDAKLRVTDWPGHLMIWRKVKSGKPSGIPADSTIVSAADYPAFTSNMATPHGNTHDWFGGTLQIEHLSASDPFFFLFHSNVDRLFTLWQLQSGHPERLDGNTIYGPWETDPTKQTALTSTMLPWDGSTGSIPWVPGNNEPTGGVDAMTPKDPQVVTPGCYDTNPPQISVKNPPGTLINFNDVPEGETAMRAAVFDCVVCNDPVHLSIVGTPTGPYSVLVGSVPVNPKGGHQDARIWLTFTGTTAGTTAPNGSVTIHCAETNQDFPFTIHGNTIARPSVAVELVLDQSGSMDLDAGTLGQTRMAVLKSAAGVFADVIQGGNAAGLVRFDTQAYGPGDPTFPGLAVTNIATDDAGDMGRHDLHTAITDHNTNPNGNTSIGAGVELGRNQLNPVNGFDKKAMIVFTDGLENTQPWIQDAMNSGAIDSETFAIGLGDATQVSTSALTQLCNNHQGYLLLTDTLTPNTDDFFRLKKYFLQILAGVQNQSIVRDPTGTVVPGQVEPVPFHLTDADIQSTVILLTDRPGLQMRIETPAGDLIDPGVAGTLGIQYTVGQGLAFYRFTLPVALGAGAQSGGWNAVLQMDPAIVKRCQEDQRSSAATVSFEGHKPSVCDGVRYSLQVHAWSNLRMRARVFQTHFVPGSTLTVHAALTEYEAPVDHRATVSAEVTRPDGTLFTLPLKEIDPGVFEAGTRALIPGIYTFLVTASGKTLRGASFTREQFLTGAVLYGGDNPLPTSGQPGIGDILCCLAKSLVSDPGIERALKDRGIDSAGLLREIEDCACAKPARPSEPRPPSAVVGTAATSQLAQLLASDDRVRAILTEVLRTTR